MKLAENEQSVKISKEYGERLSTKNVKKSALDILIAGYPSHTFVIDREEAKQLFENVEIPSDDLENITFNWKEFAKNKFSKVDAGIMYLNEEDENLTGQEGDKNNEPSEESSGDPAKQGENGQKIRPPDTEISKPLSKDTGGDGAGKV